MLRCEVAGWELSSRFYGLLGWASDTFRCRLSAGCFVMSSLSDNAISRPAPFVTRAVLALALLAGSSGCSMFVMAGKAIFGDPKVASPFTAATGEKLTDSKEAIVIICDAPHRVQSKFPAVQIDILDRVARDLETQGINVVPSGDVARWFDDHGEWGDYSELASQFKAGYVLHVNLRKFD